MQPPDEPTGHAAECQEPDVCFTCLELLDEALASLETDLSSLGETDE